METEDLTPGFQDINPVYFLKKKISIPYLMHDSGFHDSLILSTLPRTLAGSPSDSLDHGIIVSSFSSKK
jgi:hypothetical protein